MSDKEGKGTKKDGESMAKVIHDELAALQELEDQLMDRLLCRVCEESGSEELGEPKYVDTASVGKAGSRSGPGSVRQPNHMCREATCIKRCQPAAGLTFGGQRNSRL